MKLYNSATRQREEFVPNHPDIVLMKSDSTMKITAAKI